jgi:cell division protein FtsW (lipid II flippase)
MVRYFYAWTPLVVVGAVVLLSLPWLGLFALMIATIAALAALAALAWALVAAPLAVGRAIGHRWHGRSAAPQPSPALSLAEPSPTARNEGRFAQYLARRQRTGAA